MPGGEMLIALVFDRQQHFLHIKASGQVGIDDFESALTLV